MTQPGTISETIDLLDTLKELHGASYQEDPLKAAILFRTLLYIDSLHDFTNHTRFKSNYTPKKEDEDEEETDDEDDGEEISKKQSKKGQPEMTVANAKKYAGEMLKLLTDEYKNNCFYLINKSTHDKLNKVIQLFNSSKNIEFVYPDVGNNTSDNKVLENGPTKVNNSSNLQSINDKTATLLDTCGKYNLYNKNDTTLLFQYTGTKETGAGKMNRYNNKLFEEIKTNHESNKKNNVYFIILIAKLLYEINVHIRLKKFRISQNYLHTISDIITDFFGFMPINYIKKTDAKSNITTLGFIHGLLCIKHNKYQKNLSEHNSCTFTGNTAYLPNLIFTVDAEGSSKSTNYITELVKMFTDSKHIPKDEIKNVHLIKTKATKFDGAANSNFERNSSIMQKIPSIDKLPQEYHLDIIFKCGEIELMHIKYEDNTKLTISKWFDQPVSGKSKTVSGVFTLNMAVNDFLSDKTDVFNLHFKTVCDLGQILAFIAFQRYLIKNDKTIESKFLFSLHTLDKFCGQIGSLLHPGIVIEKQTMKDFTKEFPNTIYISSSEIKDEKDKRISDYNINWHTLYPGERFDKNDIDAAVKSAKAEMDKLLEDSKKKLNEKIENLKSELEQQTKRAELNSRKKRKLTRKLRFAEIATFNQEIKTAKTFAQSKANEIKLQKELQKKDESLERHRQEELERILDRESLERHRRNKIKRKEKRETKRKKRKEEKEQRKRREKSKKKREEKRRKRIRSSSSSSRSPAPSGSPLPSRSPASSSNSNTRKRRKLQSSIPPISNSKKRQRSPTPTINIPSSSSPNAKRTRRNSPSASGKKTRKKIKNKK